MSTLYWSEQLSAGSKPHIHMDRVGQVCISVHSLNLEHTITEFNLHSVPKTDWLGVGGQMLEAGERHSQGIHLKSHYTWKK